jgi:hypothetical protein
MIEAMVSDGRLTVNTNLWTVDCGERGRRGRLRPLQRIQFALQIGNRTMRDSVAEPEVS